jgi:hypothetical protein
MDRASKRAKRSGERPTSSTGAVAEDSAPKIPALRQTLGAPNTLSHLAQSYGQFGKDKSLYHQPTHDDSLEYTRSVLVGAESLGIEMTPRLQRDMGNRHGQTYSPGSFSYRTFELVSDSNSGTATRDVTGFVASQENHETVYDFDFKKDDWESDYAGIGHQFVNLSVEEDKI